MNLDRVDKHMLDILQKQGRISAADLAEMVGLSHSPCARRLRRLEDAGYIDGYHARLNMEKVGIAMTVFVEVSLSDHQVESIDSFEQAILDMPEVINCHVVSGVYDYLLEVVNPNLPEYEQFTRKLHRLDTVKDLHTHLAIRQVKKDRVMPIFS